MILSCPSFGRAAAGLTVMTFPGTPDHESHDRFPLPRPLPRAGEGRFVSRIRDFHVRRGKALSFSGCETRPATFAPAGSNWSSRGGNEAAEASGVEGPVRDLATTQAVMRMNTEQASKSVMRKPTRREYGEGRCPRRMRAKRSLGFRRGIGDGMCGRGRQTQHGKPHHVVERKTNRTPARDRPGEVGWRRGP